MEVVAKSLFLKRCSGIRCDDIDQKPMGFHFSRFNSMRNRLRLWHSGLIGVCRWGCNLANQSQSRSEINRFDQSKTTGYNPVECKPLCIWDPHTSALFLRSHNLILLFQPEIIQAFPQSQRSNKTLLQLRSQAHPIKYLPNISPRAETGKPAQVLV